MISVKLVQPIEHDGENLVPGDIIRGLGDKAAARLIRFGVAVLHGEQNPDPVQSLLIPDDATSETVIAAGGDSANVVQAGDEGAAQNGTARTLSPEELAEIQGMKKNDILEALEKMGVKASPSETKDALQEKLKQAYTAPVEVPPA